MSEPRECSVDGCQRVERLTRGLCAMHYRRWHRHGDPLRGRLTLAERFWRRVEKGDGCWLWHGPLNHGGYGSFGVRGLKTAQAHRIAYELTVGPIPDGLHIDHLCRVRACVNPDHLEPVTPAENVLRAARANASPTCPQGHEFTPENTYNPPKFPNKRICRACRHERSVKQWQAELAARRFT